MPGVPHFSRGSRSGRLGCPSGRLCSLGSEKLGPDLKCLRPEYPRLEYRKTWGTPYRFDADRNLNRYTTREMWATRL